MKTSILLLSLVLAAAGVFNSAAAATLEHREFDATLLAPYHGEDRDARTFTLSFEYPGLRARRRVTWRLELVAPSGRRVAQWQGRLALGGTPRDVAVRWSGILAGHRPAPGIYRVRLHAVSGSETADQAWDIAVGSVPAPALPAFSPLQTGRARMMAMPAPGALPYTVYYGNLHSQTRDSDGGAPVADCHGAQDPQTAPYGPDAAYPYARRHGLDFLMVSEHNHMYDGSDGTNPDADPATAKAAYRAGLKTARDYSDANPGFLALYGMEWGVIGNGGHLNIFDSDELLGWEKNAKGELLADTATPKSDYATLYALMRQRGLTGQFNHPALTGQFTVNGTPLAYTQDGDAVMALCEVVNSSAFSVSENEGETRRSNFELACNKLLEAGYHVAFSSNQDNHCANWGASYSNRSAVLIPNGVPLTRASFLEAVRARRVFATMDKDAQVVLTANGHLMGERFDNAGALRLQVAYASATGRQAATVAITEGVPGRNGDVSQLSDKADVTTTPAPGAHFYYAKVTQDDGKVLWSAPVWVTQQP
ncbi:CehA/McbA family metallohydrolase [Telluria mixta]|uniref:CehA/McbA family metallohydrolase n=1 Tax=Telluria mixta TaxID=34071 RepID=A0ABT2BVD4_9BURK|nr:CehA/McbA family metallohydrolase [Telluria mixta]MCS0629092.1 CehA/McbA family metallohydrolase [Telluria mixta]WEM97536.1 CehA/McbA family metallohydrolase [Telluria mixta]